MIMTQFTTPVPSWRIISIPGVKRDARGQVLHGAIPSSEKGVFAEDEPPVRFPRDRGRVTVINA
jgi:hypothetical protein